MLTVKAPALQIVLRPVEQPTKTETGIHLPDDVNRKIWRGEVLAYGPDVQGVNVGDIIYYPDKSGREVPIYDEDGKTEIETLISVASDVCLVHTRKE